MVAIWPKRTLLVEDEEEKEIVGGMATEERSSHVGRLCDSAARV